jgi:hypothetical protein
MEDMEGVLPAGMAKNQTIRDVQAGSMAGGRIYVGDSHIRLADEEEASP